MFDEDKNGEPQDCNLDEEYKQKVDVIHQALLDVRRDTVHLRHIPKAVDALQDLKVIISDLKDDLVGPATGKRQVPISVFTCTMGVFGLFIVILLLKDFTKSAKISAPGFSIETEKK